MCRFIILVLIIASGLCSYPQTVSIRKVDLPTLDSLIKSSNKEYKIVYQFSHKCSSSLRAFPIMRSYVEENEDIFELFPVVGYRYDRIEEVEKYLKEINYFKPVYILDTETLGNRKRAFHRLHKMTKALCKECTYNKMGYSSFFAFDRNGEIVAKNTWKKIFPYKMFDLEVVTGRCVSKYFRKSPA